MCNQCVRVFFVVVNQRQSLKLMFGDADSQLNSPTSKRRRLVTDSIDCLADLREQSKPFTGDKTPRKFRLLFGGSSEELSQPLSAGDGDDRDDDVDDDAESDVTSDSQSKLSTASDSSQSECERGKDEDMMTQADEEAMKTYVPLNAGALSYISDVDDENVLDFFLKPPSNQHGTNRTKLTNSHQLTVDADAAAVANDDDGHKRVKNSTVLNNTLSLTDRQCNNNGKELIASKLLIQEPGTVISEFIDDSRHFTAANDDYRHERVKNSTVLNDTLSLTDRQYNSSGKEPIASRLLVQEPGTVINEFIDDSRHFTASTAAHVADKSTVSNTDRICNTNKVNYFPSEVAMSAVVARQLRATTDDGVQDSDLAVSQMMCTAQSYSQGSDDFRTPASQTSTHNSVVVVDGDVTSRSAGSQPLDSDSTIDIGCSPVKSQLQSAAAAGTSPTHVASDATTTDGWCTPRKSSAVDVISPRSPSDQLTSIRPCTSQQHDRSVVDPRSPCSKRTSICTTTSQHYVSDAPSLFFRSSVPDAASPRSPGVKFATGLAQVSISSMSDPIVRPCRVVSSVSSSTSNDIATNHRVVADNYDGDVDSDSDDAISSCVGARRTVRRRLRSRSTSADTVDVSSDCDQSPLLLRSRDRSKDVVGRVDVTIVSSGSESDDGLHAGCSETDCQPDCTSTLERSPVLFSESSA